MPVCCLTLFCVIKKLTTGCGHSSTCRQPCSLAFIPGCHPKRSPALRPASPPEAPVEPSTL